MVIIKIIEVIGSSPKSWEEATNNALKETTDTISNIKSIDVERFNAKVEKIKLWNIAL